MHMIENLKWSVGYSDCKETIPTNYIPAVVPGDVHLDIMDAKLLPDYKIGNNVQEYQWIEKKYWHYTTEIKVKKKHNRKSYLVFESIDYKYIILINNNEVYHGEGLYTPVELDITGYAGQTIHISVVIYPAPKRPDTPDGRAEASASCKPIFSYQWDWCPRLISLGICGKTYIKYIPLTNILSIDLSYQLNDALDSAKVEIDYQLSKPADSIIVQLFTENNTCLIKEESTALSGNGSITFVFQNPELWWPSGYGNQAVYKIVMTLYENNFEVDRKDYKIGFRKAKLVTNIGTWDEDGQHTFPKTCNKPPITLEINGKRIFAKGSNWVPPEIFPGKATSQTFLSLLQLVKDANMNILRIWGGGYVNSKEFYDICDQLGIMVWQEFPLACTKYPDDPEYLDVLNRESISIIKKIKNHPCLVMWCGGNELFNSWSRMTEQSLALRILNSNCLKYDRFTPFIPTSPLYGMGHGHYETIDHTGKEILTLQSNSKFTAYTEFGCAAPSEWDYLETFICPDELNIPLPGSSWETHHALNAWESQESWLNEKHINYYVGESKDLKDLIEKGVYIQSLIIQHLFEEARRQWPYCSMALNWCFNEPWPTAAGNSIVNYPAKPKPAYYSVCNALRNKKCSLRITKLLWQVEEQFNGDVWLLNDSFETICAGDINVYLNINGDEKELFTWRHENILPMNNLKGPSVNFIIPPLYIDNFQIILKSQNDTVLNEQYTILCRNKEITKKVHTQLDILNLKGDALVE